MSPEKTQIHDTRESARRSPRRVPRQRGPRTSPRVTTFFDGSRWTYGVEGEPALGHAYADRGPAIAGGRYLARTLAVEHVVENEDGTVSERVDWSNRCDCHPPAGVRTGA